MTKRILVLLLVCGSVCTIPTRADRATELAIEPLRGLDGVGVAVSMGPGSEIKKLGLTQDEFQTEAESQLRKAGIDVLPGKHMVAKRGQPTLYVTLTAVKAEEYPVLAYTAEAILRQSVQLRRDPGVSMMGETWSSGELFAICPADNIEAIMLRCLRDVVGDFCNDYSAANPGGAHDEDATAKE